MAEAPPALLLLLSPRCPFRLRSRKTPRPPRAPPPPCPPLPGSSGPCASSATRRCTSLAAWRSATRGLERLGVFLEEEEEEEKEEVTNNISTSSSVSIESSLPPHVSSAASPLIRARITLLDARARCWLSGWELAPARRDVAAALALAGKWPRAAAPLLAPLLLPLAGSYCLCARERPAARAFLGAAAAASGPRAYQLQAQRQQQLQKLSSSASATTPEQRNQAAASPAFGSGSGSSSSIVQPPAGPAVPAANAAFAAAHAAFAELADPSPAGGGPAARATSVLKAGLCFPAAPAAGPGVPRTHRATAQLALGCTLAAIAAASSFSSSGKNGGGGGESEAEAVASAAAVSAAAAARARARSCFGSALAAAQRNLSNMQLTAFALGAMAPLLAYDDGSKKGGDGGESGGGGGGGSGAGGGATTEEEANVEAGRTLFIGAMDVAKQTECPAAVLAATSGWVQQGGGAGGSDGSEATAASEAYISRYEARRASRVAEAKGLAPVQGTQDTEESLATARAEHEAIVGWMPVCQ